MNPQSSRYEHPCQDQHSFYSDLLGNGEHCLYSSDQQASCEISNYQSKNREPGSVCLLMIGVSVFLVLFEGTCFKIQSKLSLSIHPLLVFLPISSQSPSVIEFRSSCIKIFIRFYNFSISTKFGCMFRVPDPWITHISKVSVYFPRVWLVFVPMLQKFLHSTILKWWTKLQTILNWSWMENFYLSKKLPFLLRICNCCI